MKISGNGKAKILSPAELKKLFTQGLVKPRDRALFAICLFSGCRISEALALKVNDIKGKTITFRKSTTKGKLRTRSIYMAPELEEVLVDYKPKSDNYLFPGQAGKPLGRKMADRILRDACTRVGIEGVSTHSFRRTALTQMSNAGVPLRHIQEVSGHSDLRVLQEYLEVQPEEVQRAVSVIGFG